MRKYLKKHARPLITLASAIFIIAGTLLAIQIGQGYRLTRRGTFRSTGLLAANSFPTGAKISIDGEFIDQLTDETINLNPGTYQVKIQKDGFSTWEKTLELKTGIVTQTNAELFRIAPSLTPLSFSGATNITPSPDGQNLAFAVASPSGQLQAGLYILELNDNPLTVGRTPQQISQNPLGVDFQDATLLWSPDSSQILASFGNFTNYLIDPSNLTKTNQLINTTASLPQILSTWEEEIERRERQLLLTLPEEMVTIATTSAKNLYFSPDGQKLMYTATASATIPEDLIPELPGSSTQQEARSLDPGSTYIYDLKEDKNFLLLITPAELPADTTQKINLVTELNRSLEITTPATSLLQDRTSLAQTIQNFKAQYSALWQTNHQWFPTSNHILINQSGSVDIIEYDGTNRTTLYAGSYLDDFYYPWPNGKKLIILTNFTGNPDLPPNLYAINLK